MTITRFSGDVFVGDSGDSKPTNVLDGARFYETDTLTVYLKVSGSWSAISGGSGTSGTGASGYSGYSGAVGATGASGLSGAVGALGAVGATGVSGLSGASGYSGAGTSGASGAAGTTYAWKGTWAYSTIYVLNDCVDNGGNGYVCQSGYSSTNATFATDLASGYWGLLTASGYSGLSGASGYSGLSGASGYSGAVGATGAGVTGATGSTGASGLSGASGYSGTGTSGTSGAAGTTYAWKGTWAYSTVYVLNDCVDNGGNSYVCQSGYTGTSATFATDLAAGKWGLLVASGYSGLSGASGLSGNAQAAIVWSVPGTIAASAVSPCCDFYVPFGCTAVGCYLAVTTVPTGTSGINVDIHYDGTSIFNPQSNRPYIAVSGTTGSSTTFGGTTSFVAGKLLRMYIDTVGTTVAGGMLNVVLKVSVP